MIPPRLSKSLTDVFTSVLLVGREAAKPTQALAVLRLLRQVNPAMPDIAAFEAQQHLRAKRYRAARELLEEAEAANPQNSLLKAMLAVTLFMQGDPMWEAYVKEARQLPPHELATSLLKALEAALNREHTPSGAEPEAPQSPGLLPEMLFGVRC
jgi:predicted Zn-dependent protease